MSEKGDETLNATRLDEFSTMQIDRLHQIKREFVNLKKDGADRKTRFHFNSRLKRVMDTRTAF